ncbi:MAG: B12-binding domain-containing radical SAM protein [Candidatus Sabulitectum sp.]|nr:B12-binding domain-containing radical SAM protein [Candidatus Sabulitectum sp.]
MNRSFTDMKFILIRPPVVHLKADFYGSIPGIPSGLAYLAASVRESGYDVSIIDAYGEDPHRFYTFRKRFRARGLTPSEIADRVPDDAIPGVSVHCASEHSMCIEIVRELKRRNPERPVLVGGYHTTFVPDDFVEAGADYVVLGEGEKRVPALLSYIEGKSELGSLDGLVTPDLSVERKEIYTLDLDSQPFAAVDLLPLENYWKLGYGHGPAMRGVKYMNILTSRGCPYKCSFCQAPQMCGGHWLSKSAEKVLEELQFHIDTYGVHDFHLQDENFSIDRKRVEDICHGILDRKMNITFCFPSGLKMETLDEDLLELLAEAGCRYFSLSPESGSTRVLKLMNKTADIQRVPRLIRKASDLGMATCCFFVAGTPGEISSDRRETRAYIRKLARAGVQEVIMPIMTPFPATPSMDSPELQGFSEMDDLCFSPVWRDDYKMLDRFRMGAYLHYYTARFFSHPVGFLQMLGRMVTGKCATKGEMTARRIVFTSQSFQARSSQ